MEVPKGVNQYRGSTYVHPHLGGCPGAQVVSNEIQVSTNVQMRDWNLGWEGGRTSSSGPNIESNIRQRAGILFRDQSTIRHSSDAKWEENTNRLGIYTYTTKMKEEKKEEREKVGGKVYHLPSPSLRA